MSAGKLCPETDCFFADFFPRHHKSGDLPYFPVQHSFGVKSAADLQLLVLHSFVCENSAAALNLLYSLDLIGKGVFFIPGGRNTGR